MLVVPSGNPAGITSVEDLGADGVQLVIGAEGVPIGDYTRTVLETMGQTAVLDNVVSNEEDVKGVLAKVVSGDADAGFVYATDAKAAGDDVEVIELPDSAQATVLYPIAIVKDAPDPDAAQAFVDLVLSDEGKEALERSRLRPPVRRAFDVVLVGATALALAFLLLPIAALFLRISPAEMVDALTSDVALDALWITLKTGLIAHVFVLLVGTPAAYFLATRRFRGRSFVITAIELPLVLPPAVAGIALLALFGRRGLLGESVDVLWFQLAFTQTAVVLAVIFVAAPFYLRAAIAAFESVDPALLDASRTLGAGPGRTFGRVALPLARSGLGAGSALAWARGTGEFGATIMFAGSLQGSRRRCRSRSTRNSTSTAKSRSRSERSSSFSASPCS